VHARWIRRAVLVVCALAVAGMIGGSIADRTGLAITAGSVGAVAVLCLLVATAVAGPGAFDAAGPVDETLAAELERRVAELVADGADEADVRAVVRLATRLERSRH
jgi:hypothetical protein